MTFTYTDPIAHMDARFIDTLYDMPVGELMEMDKACLRDFLTRTKLVSQWLEGILELTTELDREGK